jgi:hypothetical protein
MTVKTYLLILDARSYIETMDVKDDSSLQIFRELAPEIFEADVD